MSRSTAMRVLTSRCIAHAGVAQRVRLALLQSALGGESEGESEGEGEGEARGDDAPTGAPVVVAQPASPEAVETRGAGGL